MSNPSPFDLDAAGEPALPQDARAGRTFVVLLIVVNTLLALSVIGLMAAAGELDRLPRAAFRLVVNIALMYGLWRGTRWIKWFFAFGLLLTAVLCLVMLTRFQGPVMYLMLPAAGLSAWAAFTLAFGTSVNEFLAFQRNT